MNNELKTTLEALPLNAQAILRKVGARKGAKVTVRLFDGPARLDSDYKTQAIASMGEAVATDSTWLGSDGEFNPTTMHTGKMVARKNATFNRFAGRWAFTLALGHSLVADTRGGGELVPRFGTDAAGLSVLCDFIEEMG